MEIQSSSITQKGQITIPSSIRKYFSLKKGKKLFFSLEGDHIKVYPTPDFLNFKGSLSSKKPFNIKKMRKAAGKKLGKKHGRPN